MLNRAPRGQNCAIRRRLGTLSQSSFPEYGNVHAESLTESSIKTPIRSFAVIDRLERTQLESRTFTRYRELVRPLLALAIMLLVLDLLLGMTCLRALP